MLVFAPYDTKTPYDMLWYFHALKKNFFCLVLSSSDSNSDGLEETATLSRNTSYGSPSVKLGYTDGVCEISFSLSP